MKALLPLLILLVGGPSADARITRIIIDRTESPTFDGARFGDIGQYEKVIGRALGELDPKDPLNARITDIALAPRNKDGKVEYETDFYLLKPVDARKGNGVLYYDVVNRGNKRALNDWNVGANGREPMRAGDGFAMKRGYTFLWSGWQGDLPKGADRMTIRVPVAKNADGSEITGPVRMEFVFEQPTASVFFARYPAQSLDKTKAVLYVRARQNDARTVIPTARWAYADCTKVPFPGTPNDTKLCLKDGFDTDHIYELVYPGKNPLVLGVGFAATRDLVAFFRHAPKDDAGVANPLAGAIRTALLGGTSQSGRYARTFLDLGFNEDESHRMVFDGMNPHVASQGLGLNIRFGQPDRGLGQHENHEYPGADGPLHWGSAYDPVAKRTGGILDACTKTKTCPKIIQTVSSTEYWRGRMSLNTTDALGQRDLKIPDSVRIYLFSSTEHSGGGGTNRGICEQLPNPNPIGVMRRALLLTLERWVVEGKEPPASRYPRISDGTLVPAKSLVNGLNHLDFGPHFSSRYNSGVITQEPPIKKGSYVVLVPKVDADGNEIAGVRSVQLQMPKGTYTGWNLRRAGFAAGELCGLTGSFIPFANDRYKDRDANLAALKKAAENLVSAGFLLAEDSERTVAAALR